MLFTGGLHMCCQKPEASMNCTSSRPICSVQDVHSSYRDMQAARL